MKTLRAMFVRLAGLFRRKQHEVEMNEELRAHLEGLIGRNLAAGMSADEARRAALRALGGVEQIKERARDERSFVWAEQLMQDLTFAGRQMRKHPGFALVAVLSLALGIGVNTALFSVVDDVLLRSLPVHNPHELVLLRWVSGPRISFRSHSGTYTIDRANGRHSSTSFSYLIFERLRDRNDACSDLFAFAELESGALNIGVDGVAEIASGQLVSGGYFTGLGVRAIRGRTFDANDDRPGAAPAIVISHRYWQRRFGGEDAVVGKTVFVNGIAATVVGVLPREFQGTLEAGTSADVSLALALDRVFNPSDSKLDRPVNWWLHIMGRLRPGVSIVEAQARLEPAFVQAAREGWLAGLATAEPAAAASLADERDPPRLRLEPGGQGLADARRDNARPLKLLMGIVGIVLLLACLNVANLLLARGAARRREIALRLSLGASRGRIIRQLLAESVALALLGGLLGLVFAYWGREALLHLRPYGAAGPLRLNLHVLGYTMGIALGTGVLFGLAPAWQASRVDLNSALKGNPGMGVRGRLILRRTLIVAQVALSMMLLAGAGLFLRTLHNLHSLDAGFNRERLILFRVTPSLSGYRGTQMIGLYDRLLERLGTAPGVRSVALARHALLSGAQRTESISLDRPPVEGTDMNVAMNFVSPSFLPTLEIPLLLGRGITAADREGAPRVAVVNEAFVARHFPGESPVGRRFSSGGDIEIIGVVRDARYAGLRQPIPPTVYLPFHQTAPAQVSIVVRTVADPAMVIPSIRRVVQEIDPNLPVFDVRTQEEQIGRLMSEERLFAALSAFFGLLALVLTCVGLYGLLAQQVTMRTREIGIRIALGARARGVLALVLGEGVRLTAIGVALGLAAALALTRLVAGILFGVSANDATTLAGAAVVLIVVAFLACVLPARRATKVDPMTALRAE